MFQYLNSIERFGQNVPFRREEEVLGPQRGERQRLGEERGRQGLRSQGGVRRRGWEGRGREGSRAHREGGKERAIRVGVSGLRDRLVPQDHREEEAEVEGTREGPQGFTIKRLALLRQPLTCRALPQRVCVCREMRVH